MIRLWPSKRSRTPESDFDREIAFHVEQAMAAYVAEGLSPEAARRKALLEFGGREQVKQTLREVHSSAVLESLAFHGRGVLRFVRSSPSLCTAVILTLALAVGANSSVFSAVDAILLRPLPFPNSHQLVVLYQHDRKNRDANRFVAPVRVEDWNRLSTAFEGVTGYYTDDLSETSGTLPERLTMALIAPRFLQVLEVRPALGRDLLPEEEHFGGPDAILISHGFWQRRFHGDPSALGKQVRFGRTSYTVVGIMPASFRFPNREIDVWAPSPPDASYAQSRDETWFTAIGRMQPGVTVEQTQANLATVQAQLGRQFPKPDADLTVEAVPLKQTVVGSAGHSLWLLYGSVSLLLLIACSNIAALLLARTAERGHEISIRYSLGASRRRILLQLLSEVFALALTGSLLGLLLAAGAAHGFHLLAVTLPRADEIALNWRITLYSLLCAVVTTLLCGLIPAWRGTRRELARTLAQAGRTQSPAHPVPWLLVGVQVMLAVLLLTGAGLLLRSLHNLHQVQPGFDSSHVLSFQITGSYGETADYGKLIQRIDRVLDSLRSTPGVENAATAGALPGMPSKFQVEFKVDGHAGIGRQMLADNRFVSAHYFETLRIPVLEGQACRQGVSTNDLVINWSFAETYLDGGRALGHDLATTKGDAFTAKGQIRGIVADAREQGLHLAPVPTVYVCFSAPTPFPNFLVRTHGDPLALADTLRRRIHAIEPARSVYAMMPLQEHLTDASSEDRLRTLLLAAFAGVAVALASIGLYGTLSYMARMRQREVGLRLAMGALRRQIVGRFLLQGLRVTLLGCVAGLLLSVATGHWIASMLYGVSPLDARTYLSVVALVLVVASGASFAPAYRAAQVQPAEALREG